MTPWREDKSIREILEKIFTDEEIESIFSRKSGSITALQNLVRARVLRQIKKEAIK